MEILSLLPKTITPLQSTAPKYITERVGNVSPAAQGGVLATRVLPARAGPRGARTNPGKRLLRGTLVTICFKSKEWSARHMQLY